MEPAQRQGSGGLQHHDRSSRLSKVPPRSGAPHPGWVLLLQFGLIYSQYVSGLPIFSFTWQAYT